MSDTKKPTVRTLDINGGRFDLVEAAFSGRSENKGQPYLRIEPSSFDAAALLRLFSSVGPGPCVQGAIKWFNKTIADATADAYTETVAADGTKSYAFDASKAVKGIIDAIAGSVSAAKDELESKLAELRADQDKVYEAMLPGLQAGKTPNPADINKLSNIRIAIKQLEMKLEKKARKPKAAAVVPGAAPVPAK